MKLINKVSVFMLLLILALSISVTVCQASGETKEYDSYEEWTQAHTTTVREKKFYTYNRKKSMLKVKTIHTGGRLEEIVGSDRIQLEDVARISSKNLRKLGRETNLNDQEISKLVDGGLITESTGKVTITITTESDPPPWYLDYNYPQWTWSEDDGTYVSSDPINLAWLGQTTGDSVSVSKVETEIAQGTDWEDPILGSDQYIYDCWGTGWDKNDKQLADGEFDRGHVRLFSLMKISGYSIVVGGAHEEDPSHDVDSFEGAETEIWSDYFSPGDTYSWNVASDNYYLGNDGIDLDDDGEIEPHNSYCTEISEN